jgi:hypothetical protein
MTTKNLWPEFSLAELPRTPKIILNEQAEFLARRTKNLLAGNIRVNSLESNHSEIYYDFDIIAPNLNGYRYNLFKIKHKTISLYPCTLIEDVYKSHIINDEDELLSKLQEIFNSIQTQKVIKSLIAQSIQDVDDTI